ncbi:hypothetical protein ACJBXN_10430, partial [Streptococcus suis]
MNTNVRLNKPKIKSYCSGLPLQDDENSSAGTMGKQLSSSKVADPDSVLVIIIGYMHFITSW